MDERCAVILMSHEEKDETKIVHGVVSVAKIFNVSRTTVFRHLHNGEPLKGWFIDYHISSPDHENRPTNVYKVTRGDNVNYFNGRKEVAEFIGITHERVSNLTNKNKPTRHGWLIERHKDNKNMQRSKNGRRS